MDNKKTSFSIIARLKSFKHAADGVLYFFKHEPNGLVHAVAAILVAVVAVLVGITLIEWMFVVLAATLVVSAEIFNTAIEALADKVEPEFHPQIKIVKVLAAGAVLVCAIFAFFVALVVFVPKFFPNGYF